MPVVATDSTGAEAIMQLSSHGDSRDDPCNHVADPYSHAAV